MEPTVTRKLYLYFPRSEVEKPIVYHLVKDYNLIINIFRARVTPEEEGYLVLDVTGREDDIGRGMDFVRTFNVRINDATIGIVWDSTRCTHCGHCLVHCPTQALLFKDPHTREVYFDNSKCIECANCLKNCPFGACTTMF